jgi:hypothetical protein
MAFPKRSANQAAQIIDVTEDAEYFAACSRILHDGDGIAARIFIANSHIHTVPHAICGMCLSPSELGSEQVRELFATACQICERRLDLLCTPCGRSLAI